MKQVTNIEEFKAATKARAAALKPGQVILNSIKAVANGLFALEFIGSVKRESNSDRPQSLLNSLMASHEKFKEREAFVQYAYLNATTQDLATTFPMIKVADLSTTAINDINMAVTGLSIQITEQTEDKIDAAKATSYTQYNRWLKNKQTNAVVFSEGGFRIFRRIDVVRGDAKHYFVAKRRTVNTTAVAATQVVLEVGDNA